MATIKINVDDLISTGIHRPIVKGADGAELPPLYARVAGAATEESSIIPAAALSNPKWIEACKTNYNSPTNVRRLFIGESKALIQYYRPIVSGGQLTDGVISISSFRGENAKYNVKDVVMHLLNGDNSITIHGNPFKCISDPVMSNLEEVYISPYFFMDQSKSGDQSWNNIQSCVSGILSGKLESGRVIKFAAVREIFEKANGSNISNIRNRFPRIKYVGVAPGLDTNDFALVRAILGQMDSGLPTNLGSVTMTWLDKALQLKKQRPDMPLPFMAVAECPYVDGTSEDDKYLKFYTRPGIYLYDRDVLDPYFESFKTKSKDLARQQSNPDASQQSEQTQAEKTEIEKLIDSIYDSKGPECADNLVRRVAKTFSAHERSEIVKQLGNSPNAVKYSAFFKD